MIIDHIRLHGASSWNSTEYICGFSAYARLRARLFLVSRAPRGWWFSFLALLLYLLCLPLAVLSLPRLARLLKRCLGDAALGTSFGPAGTLIRPPKAKAKAKS